MLFDESVLELELFLNLLELESSIFEDEDSSSVMADADESSPQATVMDRNVSAKNRESYVVSWHPQDVVNEISYILLTSRLIK
jgi:hypothetical protein